MPTTIARTSINTMSRLIRNEFDSIDFENEYTDYKAQNLIKTARDYGLEELAKEMENDLQ